MTTETLDARAARSRDAIMRALADVVSEQGVAGFSVQEVADRAGVAHRTVYRHYGSREELLDGYARWLDERLVGSGGVTEVERADDIPAGVETTFRLLEELDELGEALVMASIGTGARLSRRDERTREFRRALDRAGVLSHLSEDDAEAVTALIRTIASSNVWFQFRHQHGIDGLRAGRAAAWAVETLLGALAAGGGPACEGSDPPKEEGPP